MVIVIGKVKCSPTGKYGNFKRLEDIDPTQLWKGIDRVLHKFSLNALAGPQSIIQCIQKVASVQKSMYYPSFIYQRM